MTFNRKGKVNGAEFDGVQVIVQKGKKLDYTEDAKNYPKSTNLKNSLKMLN